MPPKRPLSVYSDSSSGKRQKNEEENKSREDAIRRAKERIAKIRDQSSGSSSAKEQEDSKPSGSNISQSLKDRIAAAKAKMNEKKQMESSSKSPEEGRGLNVELHPLLLGKEMPPAPIENPNIVKVNKRGFQVNPYLSGVDSSRRKRDLNFSEAGKYIKEADEVRKGQRLAELKKRIDASTKKAGLEPDLSIGEDKYKAENPPQIEWWDMPLVLEGNYEKVNEGAISLYVQHPVPINAPWERHLPPPKAMYLTKKEMKRIRRNDRSERYKEQQDRIKLGLEPTPPPKVKLSNLMSALTNEAIKDPTAVEQRVRKEVEDRRLKHVAANEERKLSKEQRHEKQNLKYEKDLAKGYYTAVFIVNRIEHPSHRYKIDVNAKQLNLVGTLLHNERFNLVIVEGSEKNVKFYKKLMTKRIKWTQNVTVDDKEIDLSDNVCDILWEGQLKDLHFKKWSQFHADNETDAVSFLQRFSVDNYWIEATSLRPKVAN